MADGAPPAPPVSTPVIPPVQLPVPSIQLIVPRAQPIPAQPIQPAHALQFNWLYFKPEFTGKPDEDAEAHLLRTNNWMDTHAFQEGGKVQ